MTAVSSTIEIKNNTYQSLATLAGITMTKGKTYSIQIQNIVNFKVANAEFTFTNKEFNFMQGDDTVYVKIPGDISAVITILENIEKE